LPRGSWFVNEAQPGEGILDP